MQVDLKATESQGFNLEGKKTPAIKNREGCGQRIPTLGGEANAAD
jgi:hypothetical protein